MTSDVNCLQKGVAPVAPSLIMARRQLSSLQPGPGAAPGEGGVEELEVVVVALAAG
jgi:hypothetical protein